MDLFLAPAVFVPLSAHFSRLPNCFAALLQFPLSLRALRSSQPPPGCIPLLQVTPWQNETHKGTVSKQHLHKEEPAPNPSSPPIHPQGQNQLPKAIPTTEPRAAALTGLPDCVGFLSVFGKPTTAPPASSTAPQGKQCATIVLNQHGPNDPAHLTP